MVQLQIGLHFDSFIVAVSRLYWGESGRERLAQLSDFRFKGSKQYDPGVTDPNIGFLFLDQRSFRLHSPFWPGRRWLYTIDRGATYIGIRFQQICRMALEEWAKIGYEYVLGALDKMPGSNTAISTDSGLQWWTYYTIDKGQVIAGKPILADYYPPSDRKMFIQDGRPKYQNAYRAMTEAKKRAKSELQIAKDMANKNQMDGLLSKDTQSERVLIMREETTTTIRNSNLIMEGGEETRAPIRDSDGTLTRNIGFGDGRVYLSGSSRGWSGSESPEGGTRSTFKDRTDIPQSNLKRSLDRDYEPPAKRQRLESIFDKL